MNTLSDAQLRKLAEIGKQVVLVRLHNRRNAAYNRALLRAVQEHKFNNDRSLIAAISEIDNSLALITDDDVVNYLNANK